MNRIKNKSLKKSIVKILAAVLLITLVCSLQIPVFAEPEQVLLEDILEEASGEVADIALEETSGENPDLDHSAFAEHLLERLAEEEGQITLHNLPVDENRKATMPSKGNVNALGIHVSFPEGTGIDETGEKRMIEFAEGDNLQALQAAMGQDSAGVTYPSLLDPDSQYANLHGYYERASLGTLSLSGDAVAYEATRARDDYEDQEELILEILAAFDEDIDYSQYDSNDDQIIDCIYLHIPVDPDMEWGSQWWPACHPARSEESFDGCKVGTNIVLSRDLTTEGGLQTIIHETGHAIGFPDYYCYPDENGFRATEGIGTFDMMNNNIGDHNGLSKWVAGWLDDRNITRVVANENGVIAKKDGAEVGTKEEDGSLLLELGSYDSDTVGETGGIIALGNTDEAPYSSFFLIQYETPRGNQKITYETSAGTAALDAGFRVYRVLGQLDEYGNFVHNCTTDPTYNKLIELVNPVVNTEYWDIQNGRYSDFFYEGMTIGPKTVPSSNFYENINTGFTGITIEFLTAGENAGTLKISYSEEEKPEEKAFEIGLSDAALIPGGYQLTFQANQQISLRDNNQAPYAIVDGDASSIYYLRNMYVEDDKLIGDVYIDTDQLKPSSEVVMRFNDGMFVLNGGAPSEQIRMQIPVAPDLVSLTASGVYDNTLAEAENSVHVLTPMLTGEDGSYYFYGYVDDGTMLTSEKREIFRYSFTAGEPEKLDKKLLDTGSSEYAAAEQLFKDAMEKVAPSVSALPENAELADYPFAADVIKEGDYYYVLSYQADPATYNETNELALTKLDKNGALVEQVIPIGNDIEHNPSRNMMARLLPGPEGYLAVLLYGAYPYRDFLIGELQESSATRFFDADLNPKGLTAGFSTGCCTWLPDGRYMMVGQRNINLLEDIDRNYNRQNRICYDITESFTGGTTPEPVAVTPAPTDINRLLITNTGVIAKWEKGQTGTTGYQIQYSLHRSFKNASKITVRKASVTSKKIKGLEANKAYYFRVRTYQNVDGKNYFSKWSGAEKVNTGGTPNATSIRSLLKINKGFKVTWSKNSKATTGYQIEYSTARTFKDTSKLARKTTRNLPSTGKKIMGLKAKKTYYVRVRAYRKTGKKIYYGKWSTVKKVQAS